jgi:hypothetical protein
MNDLLQVSSLAEYQVECSLGTAAEIHLEMILTQAVWTQTVILSDSK